ncbi:SDR family oxidoreductase [candidate division KSB1 bacterium]|nr:SDR family oxidoreductase [candidate division KSB1 bacterium]
MAGKTAVVTGSGRGLGKRIAWSIAEDGAQVIINYLKNRNEAEKTVGDMRAAGLLCHLVQADMRRESDVRRLLGKAVNTTGRIDILINAVGDFAEKPLLETDVLLWRQMLDSNLVSAFLACKAVVPIMQKQKWGRIVNIGLASAASIHAYRDITPYAVAKTGVLILTQSLARQLAEDGITVNCVSPGVMRDGSLPPTISEEEIPMQRWGTADDLMAAIRFLIGEEAGYVSGSNILVSGAWGV